MKNKTTIATIAALISQLIFGLSFMFTKIALKSSSPLTVIANRYMVAFMRSDAENVIGQEERDTTLHQSVADGSQPFDDLTTQQVLAFEEAQGGSGYETEAVEINATHVYVTIGGTASVYYSINGGTAVEIDPASRMPVAVEIDPGDEIQFSCQNEAPDVVLNYYPTDASQQQAQQNNEL